MKKHILIFTALAISMIANAQSASRQLFTEGWRFMLSSKEADYSKPNAKDSNWRTLNLPHDWAIEGDFSKDNPSGTGGGALPGGVGWYRKTFTVDKADKGKSIRIDFDGAYMNAAVYINGKHLGTRPYGYISFGYDITPYIKYGKENTIAVRVDNSDQPNSRWYSGCGIYRNVWLTKQNPIHVAKDGVYVTTADVSKELANIYVETDIVNPNKESLTVYHTLYNAEGKRIKEGLILRAQSNKETSKNEKVADCCKTESNPVCTIKLKNPHLWSTKDPYLYTLVTTVRNSKGEVLDTYSNRIGIRWFEFSKDGFTLNDEPMQIQGVCDHHDLGCLGAALNVTALRRQLQILKDAGINGFRCSHNPPAPELLDLCDEMGFIVMDESFDMWRKKKTANDYAKYFNEWHERDLHDFIIRDRNHPSIVMWSIGNEVLEQWSDAGADTLSLEEANLILNFGHSADQLANDDKEMSVNSLLTKKLADFVRNLDPSRPITSGCNEPNPNNHLFKSDALDIIGYNYHNQNIPDVPKNFPGKPFIITESVSSLQTRGYYRMNSDHEYVWPERWDKPFEDPTFSCSSYDNCHAPWSNTHEENIIVMRKYPWIAGQYIWTGFDYIGEPTPYGWPARSSYFGFIDLAGFPKDSYYMYKAELTDTPTLHLFPHWNFGNEEYAGEDIAPSKLNEDGTIDMWAYYNNADEVELFINGKSQGISKKTQDRLHAQWRVKYEPGEVMAVARKNGQVVNSQIIKTAGKPAQIRLTADRNVITADGRDLSFITVEILDKDGNLCPNASNLVNFAIEGNATIAGVDNGSPISLERFKDNKRHAFYGKCLVVLQNNGTQGKATLKATSNGLQNATIEISAQ